MIRVIVSQKGNKEQVFFTEDFDTPVSDFLTHGFELTVYSDLNIYLPIMFPMERILEVQE